MMCRTQVLATALTKSLLGHELETERGRKEPEAEGSTLPICESNNFKEHELSKNKEMHKTTSSCKWGNHFQHICAFHPPQFPLQVLSAKLSFKWVNNCVTRPTPPTHCSNPNRWDILAGQGHPNPGTLVQQASILTCLKTTCFIRPSALDKSSWKSAAAAREPTALRPKQSSSFFIHSSSVHQRLLSARRQLLLYSTFLKYSPQSSVTHKAPSRV